LWVVNDAALKNAKKTVFAEIMTNATHWRSEGGAGHTERHLLGAANGRKLFLKIHVKIQIVISYVFACNKNKTLQLQRLPILSILGYNVDLYFKQALQFPKPKTKGWQI